VKNFSKDAIDSISTGLIEHAEKDCADRGVVTIMALKSVLQERDTEIMAKFTDLLQRVPAGTPPAPVAPTMDQSSLVQCTYKVFTHDVDRRHTKTSPRLWPVPEDFQLPDSAKTPLNSAFQLWFGGDPSTGVLPFRKLDKGSLGVSVARLRNVGVNRKLTYPRYHDRIEHTAAVLSDWRRVMQPFEESVLSRLSDLPTGEELSSAYDVALKILRESYVAFVFKRSRHSQLCVATWAKFLKPSVIMSIGTATDKKCLGKRRRSCPKNCSGSQLSITEALERGETPPKIATV